MALAGVQTAHAQALPNEPDMLLPGSLIYGELMVAGMGKQSNRFERAVIVEIDGAPIPGREPFVVPAGSHEVTVALTPARPASADPGKPESQTPAAPILKRVRIDTEVCRAYLINVQLPGGFSLDDRREPRVVMVLDAPLCRKKFDLPEPSRVQPKNSRAGDKNR